MKTHTNKHLVIPLFFNEPPDLTGFPEGRPGTGRIVAIKSVVYSDGSAVRWYKVEAVKKLNRKKHKLKREKS